MLVSAVVVFGPAVLASAPAGADPNPFGTLSSSCHDTAGRDALIQGIRRGISDWSAIGPRTSAHTTCSAQPPPSAG